MAYLGVPFSGSVRIAVLVSASGGGAGKEHLPGDPCDPCPSRGGMTMSIFRSEGRKGLRPVLLALFVAAATASGPVLAVHNEGLFQLDGNAIDDPGVPGIDWADVFANQGQPGNTFVTDAVNTN